MEDLYERLGISVNKAMEHRRVKNRMANLLERYFEDDASTLKPIIEKFAFRAGHTVPSLMKLAQVGYALGWVTEVFKTIKTYPDLYFNIQCLLDALVAEQFPRTQDFAKGVQDAFDLSPGFGVRISFQGGVPELYPKGDRLLDQALIDETLQRLQPYKGSADAFKTALTTFQAEDASRYRVVAESLRFSLEDLLQQIFGKHKPLEKQKPALSKWLREKHLHQRLINMVAITVEKLALYNNEWAKHPGLGDHVPGTAEVEFVIYQTGVVMRLVLQLAEDTQNAAETD